MTASVGAPGRAGDQHRAGRPVAASLSRAATYLRVSVTDRCNQRCVYCMPAEGVPDRPHDDILRFEEVERVVRVAAALGVRSVRLTGGEPLVRKGLVGLAARLAALPGVQDLALTTNGTLLARAAPALRAAGVRRVNVSLDTLRPDRYRDITRTDLFSDALAGLEAALAAGLDPVKVNTVVIRGRNDDEVEEMALRAAEGRVVWRFIELMPLGEARNLGEDALVPADEIVGRLAALARARRLTFVPVSRRGGAVPSGAGPARYYRLGRGLVGVISPMTHGFCSSCNRLRLTSDGRLHPCLASPLTVDLAGPLRSGVPDGELARLILEGVARKPDAHRLAERPPALAGRRMSDLGG